MSLVAKAMIWASVLILLALGNGFGLVEDKVANTLFVVLPILAVTSLRGGLCRCLPGRGKAA